MSVESLDAKNPNRDRKGVITILIVLTGLVAVATTVRYIFG